MMGRNALDAVSLGVLMLGLVISTHESNLDAAWIALAAVVAGQLLIPTKEKP